MDPEQIFATGGVSGIVGLILLLLWRFFNSRHRIRSKCCGKEISIDTDATVSPEPSPVKKPLEIKVDNGASNRADP